MSYMKLLKLLYFADRTALITLGRPITYDRYVSMPQGPVLSRTCDLMVSEDDPIVPSYWRRYISAPTPSYEITLLSPAPGDPLSDAEESILDSVFEQYGGMSRWQVRDIAHELPEWKDPEGSATPIDVRDILRAGNVDEADADAIIEGLLAEACIDQLAG